ncbi:MAG: hypothetical protein ACLS8R_09090 [Anaeromassilibacillus sp.]
MILYDIVSKRKEQLARKMAAAAQAVQKEAQNRREPTRFCQALRGTGSP